MVLGLLAMMLSITVGQVRPTPPPAWLTALKSPNPKIRQEAISLAPNAGAKAVVPLVKLLFNARSEVYQSALQALRGTVYHTLREGESGTRRAVIEALFSQISPTAKHANALRTVLLELLGVVAQEQDVPRIATYFKEPALRETARIVLTGMNYPSVNRLLLASLPLSSSSFQVGLIQSIEDRKIGEAVPYLQSNLSSPNPEVRLATIHALGSLPDVSSASLLWNKMEGSGAENRAALHAYLALAEALLQRGENANAYALYARVLSVALTSAERCAALMGLVKSDASHSEALLEEALASNDHEVQGLAIRLLSENPSAEVTKKLLSVLSQGAASLRSMLIQALAQRQGESVREAILEASLSQEHALRTSAFRAILVRTDVSDTTRLQVFHRALPVAQTDTERLVLLSGLSRISNPTSLPYLFDNLVHKGVQGETWVAISHIADRIAHKNHAGEATTAYERIIRGCENEALVRHATQQLRELGVRADFAAQAGYIEHWWVLGALPGREAWRTRDAFKIQLPVELEQPLLIGERTYRWQYVHLDNPRGMLDLGEITAVQGKAGTYAYAEVSSPTATDALVKIGSDDDYFCWVNGLPVARFVGDRGWKPDEDVVRVRLTAGVNRLLVKVLNGGGSWQVSLRLTDTENQPLLLAQRAKGEMAKAERATNTEVASPQGKRVLLPSGLEYVELVEGTGEIAQNGDNVAVHYSGMLSTGKLLQSTREKGEPLYFTLGNGQVIQGFDLGIRGMRVGGKRRLIIPPSLAYGERGEKGIPPKATLTFEVELLGVEH